ncbi:flagellar motor switch protein FliN [Roseimaritima ulvae]|uniref:Flagellar motor switch protein FliN n=1 Tax=Roseimaritima ulvae TaxID=980254 RepID=A0A5B9QV28_9BACT|nr:flagellar motor switch protein FliN [Roseimaritima ulvae]QEG42884.1 Flagellar motor switch protein FliN [Roseimaritima ulvae]
MSESPLKDEPQAAADDQQVSPHDIEKLISEAQAGIDQAAGSDDANAQPFQLNNLEAGESSEPPHSMDLLGDVELDLRIELGRTQMRLEEVLRLRSGAVVALDKLAGDPVDIYVNGRLIARGEVLVMNDNFCVRVTELLGGSE